MAVVRYRIIVTGRVQGVGFRASCWNEADRLGLAGTVRNLPNGTVELFVEGPEADVEQLIDWCRVGPRYARVDSVERSAETPAGAPGFSIS